MKYAYIAKLSPQKTVQAVIEAESEQDAVNKLNRMGYFPISLAPEELTLNKDRFIRFSKSSKQEVALFTRQLASLTESGVNIINSLNIVLGQTVNRYLRQALADIIARIKDGNSLSESLKAHPDLFSSLYTAIIHSGEIGGNLNLSLIRLADFLEGEEEFKNSLRAALTYPIFVFAVGTLTVITLLTFVIPRLVTMFEDMGQALPLPTRILIGLSAFLRAYWWMNLAVIVISVFLFQRFYLHPQGRIICDRLKLKIFLLKEVVLKSETSRLMRTLSLLLSSGIQIVSALDISSSVLRNQVLKITVLNFKDQINSGLSFSQCLNNAKLFPALVTNIVTVGEETGTLERSLLRIADDYEREVDRLLKSLTRLLEPVIILVMGLIVGFIVLAMLLPILQINLIVK